MMRGGEEKLRLRYFECTKGSNSPLYSQLLWKLMMPLKTLSIDDCADSLTGQVAIICAQWDYEYEQEEEEEEGRM